MTTNHAAAEDHSYLNGGTWTVPMYALPQPSGAVAEAQTNGEDALEVCALLERASRRLDQMWNESWGLRDSRLWIQLGEASHSLHRTLIALREQR